MLHLKCHRSLHFSAGLCPTGSTSSTNGHPLWSKLHTRYKHTHTQNPFLLCPISFLARRFGRLSRRKNTFPFVPLQGNSRLAPRICATTAQREVQCVADHLWIHHQGQADTCQGKRHENFILSLERIGGRLLHESSVAWPWSLKVTHKGRNTGCGV